VPRLFVAVRPPADVLAGIGALERRDEAGVRWVPPEQWHVTVRFLGEAPLDAAVAALEAARPALRVLGPVEAVVGPQVARLGRHVVCLPVAGLDGVAAVVGEVTATVGQPPDPRPFRGHVTLARLQQRAACGLAGQRFRARFPVREIELVQSELGRDGARHTVVHTIGFGSGAV
jgi:2'-5' RNA ligase